jgi:hypothetical protein
MGLGRQSVSEFTVVEQGNHGYAGAYSGQCPVVAAAAAAEAYTFPIHGQRGHHHYIRFRNGTGSARLGSLAPVQIQVLSHNRHEYAHRSGRFGDVGGQWPGQVSARFGAERLVDRDNRGPRTPQEIRQCSEDSDIGGP